MELTKKKKIVKQYLLKQFIKHELKTFSKHRWFLIEFDYKLHLFTQIFHFP